MAFHRESSVARARWVAVFAFLLLACSAVPVFAAEPTEAPSSEPTGFTPPTSKEEEVAATQVPDAAEISKAIGEAEREEVEHEEWLASPEAEEQREDSLFAFAGLPVGESEELLRSVFGEQLEALNTDPSRFLSDAQLVRPLGDSGAVVKDEGEGSLLETTVPVRTEDEDGQLAKVDLSLEPTSEGFQTENAISDLVLPSSADEPIQVGEKGVEIAQGGAANSTANTFGDKNLFYPSVLPDTDLLVAANSFGAEIFNLLRSKDSPEDLRFDIGLPDGAELRSDERGGAEVVQAGERLTLIPKPYAIDAQGTEIPVQMEVEERSINLHVAHREGDYAYPALIDPIIEDWVNQGQNWYGGNNWAALSNGAWKFTRNNSNIGTEGGEICCWEGSHAGLLVNMRAAFYGPEQFGQWAYSTGNAKTYITHIWLIPFNRADMGCGSDQPHDYAGLWSPGSGYTPIWLNFAKNYGNLAGDGVGQSLVIGEGSGPPGVWLACNRLLYAGGVGIWLNDDWGPIISPTGIPSQWFSDADHLNVDIYAGDEGLGVHRVTITPEGKPVIQDNVGYCTGLYGNRCPNDYTAHFAVTGDSFGEGIRTTGTVAEDPTGKTAGTQFTTKVDRTPPEVTVEGQFAAATHEEKGDAQDPKKWEKLKLSVYNLKIGATDGSLTNNLTKRSGVKDIEVFLDGKKLEVPWSPLASCPETSCSMTKLYQVKMDGVVAGRHTLEVKAIDFVNKVRERNIEFEYIPATGMKDEYVMWRFPLPDGEGSGAGEETDGSELAVNVMNGNLVYHERDIKVQGPAVNLELERFYNSQLPDAQNTEWGDGWTLAQTPDLEPFKSEGSPVVDTANVVSNSGALEGQVPLPTTAGTQSFDPALLSTVTKKSDGGYVLTDETGQSSTSVSFSESGRTEARLTDGSAKVDYSYEVGVLSEIEVQDPATFSADPEELDELGPSLIEKPTYSSSYGTLGSGDGQLKSPGDVAVDTAGNLWVVDKGNNRVEKFDSAGKYLSNFGVYGSGNGQFNRPTSIAITSNGDLLVTDAGNGRIERFSSAGVYLSQFGAKGTGNGQFTGSGPEGVTIDATGNIWVADTYGGRVQKFSSTGAFIKIVGSKGSGSGQLGEPTGIDVDSSGNVWVTDWQNNRVSVFNNNGEFLSQFGSVGTGNGQFSHPDAIEVDDLGNVWVGDQSNNRVQQFDLAAQYVGKFGSTGSGAAQFSFAYPMGIAADSKGHLWIADVNNNRVQRWQVPLEKPAYLGTFATNGSGDGQLKTPSGVAVGFGGNLWVVDKGNNRIEKFDSSGKFLSKFGTVGSGDGQLSRPTAIAVDRDGNLLVADSNNCRIEKFNQQGEFISKFGIFGTGNGQFFFPEGIATDFKGNIWVADTYNGRLQKFNEEGEFIKVVGSKGAGSGQLNQPTGIDVDPSGNVWVADSQNNRVSVFNNNGEFISQFGSAGTGNGQFNRPNAINIDAHNNVWVADQTNNRVQRFNLAAQYVGQFGSSGSGAGGEVKLAYVVPSFANPTGIASDAQGHLWIADVNNNRIQQWQLGNYVPIAAEELNLNDGDPSVDVETSNGLVSAVKGVQAGENIYQHVGNRLTSYTGPEGETKYTYDSAGRMTKVTLPNGTWGEITYNQTYGRVSSVTVKPAGAPSAKKTEFEFFDEPRRTVVIPPDSPHVTYDIGEDGSVLKWWNALQPPLFDDIAGDLYDNRGKELVAGDHELLIQAHSEEGIASIKVIANGSDLVDEKTCEQTEAPGIECKTEIDAWVTSTDEHPPGRLDLEVIITDRLGQMAAERFWVNIPPPPPPPAPGTPIPPKFRDIAKFREEFGLDVVDPVANEIELNERIFNLIKAWYEPETSEGQVARATMERWGVPLRPRDVAELEYRERYVDQAATALPEWVEAHTPSTYAGYYVDHRLGGILYVGFTQDTGQIEALKQAGVLVAPGVRIKAFVGQPSNSLASLEALQSSISESASTVGLITRVGLDVENNNVSVGAINKPEVESALKSLFGAQAPIDVYSDVTPGIGPRSRSRYTGIVKAGDLVRSEPVEECTAGFGAWDENGTAPTGEPLLRHFLLLAGHCFENAWEIYRWQLSSDGKVLLGRQRLGYIRRRSYHETGQAFTVDAAAARLESAYLAPRLIYFTADQSIRIDSPIVPHVGMVLCHSGITSNRPACGPVLREAEAFPYLGHGSKMWQVPFKAISLGGDSGGPVWEAGSGRAVGLLTAGAEPIHEGEAPPKESYVTPLLPTKGHPAAPGVLSALGENGQDLRLVKWQP